MKYFALLAVAIVAYVDANPIVNTGASSVSRSDDGHGNYAFAYNEDHSSGGSFRKEKGGPGVQIGSYGLRDHDGRLRIVNYVADAHGFRADIQTNEPGTDAKEDPAAVSINGGALIAAAPIVAAPVAYAAGPAIGHGYGAGPIGHGVGPLASYSVTTKHVSAPAIGYGAGPLGYGAGAYGGLKGYGGLY